MHDPRNHTTRRAFFAGGAALLGSGVAAASATAPTPGGKAAAADREAIRAVQRSALTLLQASRYGALAQLFADGGAAAIETLARETALHKAYRHDLAAHADVVALSEDGTIASTTLHVETEVSTPLEGEETIVAMARLQGNWADRRHEPGRFEARYARVAGNWMMTSLRYFGA
jgi:hypothetical protein